MPYLGYARVSTLGQSLDAQIEQLRAAGCERIYMETASGARSDRKQLKRILREIRKDDVLLVTRLDRLARSTIDLLSTIAGVAERGARFKSLAEPWADTTTPGGRFVLTVLGGLAEFERHLIRERTAEGRERARRAGVRFGPKPKLTDEQREEVKRRRAEGHSLRRIGRELGVSANTVGRVR
jgi:DNA invertase Pin-like site-specific DNA recombinase